MSKERTLQELLDLRDSYAGKEDEESVYYYKFYDLEIVYKIVRMCEKDSKFRKHLIDEFLPNILLLRKK